MARNRNRAKARRAAVSASGPVPASWPISWWQSGYRLPSQGQNAAVEACIGALSQTTAMLPLDHWRENEQGGADRVTTSAASRVLRKPNDYQTRADFILNLIRAELYSGNGYALAQRNLRQEVSALHLVRAQNMAPFVNEVDGSVYYQFSSLPIGQSFEPVIEDLYPARDVLHIRMHTPVNPLIGESPITAAAVAIDSGNAIANAMAAFHGNMARPSGFLKIPGQLKPDVANALREEWQAAYNGINNGRIAVLQNGIEWMPLSMSAVDAAIIDSYKMSIADIARVFRTPGAIIGDNSATYNNTEVLMKFWLSTGLGYMLEHIELALDALFGLPPGEWISFDRDALLRADFAARIEGLVKGVQGALFSPNEARAREGLPRVPFGDEPRVQAQVVPLSFASKPPEPTLSTAPTTPSAPSAPAAPQEDPEDDEDDSTNEERAITADQIVKEYEEMASWI